MDNFIEKISDKAWKRAVCFIVGPIILAVYFAAMFYWTLGQPLALLSILPAYGVWYVIRDTRRINKRDREAEAKWGTTSTKQTQN